VSSVTAQIAFAAGVAVATGAARKPHPTAIGLARHRSRRLEACSTSPARPDKVTGRSRCRSEVQRETLRHGQPEHKAVQGG